jgi:tyrosine-protein kinase Etk/Wzc
MTPTTELPSVLPTTVATTPAAGAASMPQIAPLTPARKAWVENISILLAHKWLIVSVTAVVTIATGIYAFTKMPNVYTARAVLLPARHEGGSDAITAGISNTLKDIGLAKLKGGEESYSPLSLMNSRGLQEGLVRQFNFQKVYNAPTMEGALKEFSSHLDGELTEEGNFIVAFTDTSSARAAEVANAAVDGINEVDSRLAKEEAVHNLTYIQRRYATNLADLDSAEKQLGEFQRKYGIFSVTEQAKAEMSALAELEQQRYSAEIALQNAIQQYGSNSAEVNVYRTTINQITSKLSDMQTGLDLKASSFVPTSVMPDVALQYLRLMRDVEIQSKLKAFLLPSFEQAKLDQNRTLLGYVTLDRAIPPMQKSGPHRSTLLLTVMLGAAFVVSVFVILLSNFRHVRSNFELDRQRIFSGSAS